MKSYSLDLRQKVVDALVHSLLLLLLRQLIFLGSGLSQSAIACWGSLFSGSDRLGRKIFLAL